jgi:two-component system sensor histidine kinase VanS
LDRAPGLSARVKLTLSYAGFIMLAGVLLLAAVWVFLLRYVPDQAMLIVPDDRVSLSNNVFPIRSQLLEVFAPRAAAVLAALLAFGLAGGWILAGRMLAPLTRITEAARTAGTRSLSHRIRLPGRRDEFRDLADAFDGMLEQLESHVAEQQRFAANASHELRTPLAVTRALLDVGRRDPGQDRDELLDRLHAANQRAIDLTEALLVLSRGGGFTPEPVDLSLLAEEAAEGLLALAEQRGVRLEVTGEPAWADGSAELLSRMVTNLVQNAVVHNQPGGGGDVTVHTEVRGAECVLRVVNTGDQVAPASIPALVEPFQRGTERIRNSGHAGVGLGLAIVNRVVGAHGGRLSLVPGPEGGLDVTVRLAGSRFGGLHPGASPPE